MNGALVGAARREADAVRAWLDALRRNGCVITERMGSRPGFDAVSRDSRDAARAEDRDAELWARLDVRSPAPA